MIIGVLYIPSFYTQNWLIINFVIRSSRTLQVRSMVHFDYNPNLYLKKKKKKKRERKKKGKKKFNFHWLIYFLTFPFTIFHLYLLFIISSFESLFLSVEWQIGQTKIVKEVSWRAATSLFLLLYNYELHGYSMLDRSNSSRQYNSF